MRINLTHILQAPLSARVQHKQVCVGQISVVAPQENLLHLYVHLVLAASNFLWTVALIFETLHSEL